MRKTLSIFLLALTTIFLFGCNDNYESVDELKNKIAELERENEYLKDEYNILLYRNRYNEASLYLLDNLLVKRFGEDYLEEPYGEDYYYIEFLDEVSSLYALHAKYYDTGHYYTDYQFGDFYTDIDLENFPNLEEWK
jgi:cell division protein FtsB